MTPNELAEIELENEQRFEMRKALIDGSNELEYFSNDCGPERIVQLIAEVRRLSVAAVILLAMCLLAAPTFAGAPCQVRQSYTAHHAPAYTQLLVLVGQPIRDEALIERVARKLIAERDAKQNHIADASKMVDWKSTATGQPVAPSAPDGSPSLLIKAKCARCHTGPDAKGAFVADGSAAVDDKHLGAFTRMATRGVGVPDAMKPLMEKLTPAEKSQIVDELSGLMKVEATSADAEPGELK